MSDILSDPSLDTESKTETEPVAPVNPKGSGMQKLILLAKQGRGWLVFPPIIFGAVVFWWANASQKKLPTQKVPEQTISVDSLTVQPQQLRAKVVGYGTAQPARQWTAISEVSGRIVKLHPDLDSGNWIDAGEVLIEIDKSDYELRFQQREADWESAQAGLDELVASEKSDQTSLAIEEKLLKVKENDRNRLLQLQSTRSVSTTEIDRAEGDWLRQKQSVQKLVNSIALYPSRIASAKAKVKLAESAKKEARRNVERTTIKSPFRGVISGVGLEVGQVLSTNQQLFQILDNRRLEIEAQVSLSQLGQLFLQKRASLEFVASKQWLSSIEVEVVNRSGGVSYRWRGRPLRLTESFDSQTRTVGIVVEVTNTRTVSKDISEQANSTAGKVTVPQNGQPEKYELPLKPGTYCEVNLLGKPQDEVIALPRTAIDGEQVYLVDDENRIKIRDVRLGQRIGEQVVVRSGIVPGDRVIIKPPVPAIEGMLVRRK